MVRFVLLRFRLEIEGTEPDRVLF